MTVTRTDALVTIDGVAGFDTGEFASSVHGCMARIARAVGEGVTYEDLVCYNGFAFRVGVHAQWCPSAGHPCCGFFCVNDNVLPWATRCFTCFPWDEAKADQAAFEAEVYAAVAASIDRGIPVQYSREEDGLIIGYADGGRRWWCVHPYHRGGREAFWHDEVGGFAGGHWPWSLCVWTAPKPAEQRVPPRDLLLGALRQAVTMWTTEKIQDYYCGAAAYAFWLSWLRDMEAGTIEAPAGGVQGNSWCFDVLLQNRRIAGSWLARQADAYPAAAPHLRAAAASYTRLVEVCLRDINCPWDLTTKPADADGWTSRQRQEQIARLEAACALDAAAIGEIALALQAEE